MTSSIAHDPARDAVGHDLGDRLDAGGHHRDRAEAGFDQHRRHAVATTAREHDDIGGGVRLARVGDRAREHDPPGRDRARARRSRSSRSTARRRRRAVAHRAATRARRRRGRRPSRARGHRRRAAWGDHGRDRTHGVPRGARRHPPERALPTGRRSGSRGSDRSATPKCSRRVAADPDHSATTAAHRRIAARTRSPPEPVGRPEQRVADLPVHERRAAAERRDRAERQRGRPVPDDDRGRRDVVAQRAQRRRRTVVTDPAPATRDRRRVPGASATVRTSRPCRSNAAWRSVANTCAPRRSVSVTTWRIWPFTSRAAPGRCAPATATTTRRTCGRRSDGSRPSRPSPRRRGPRGLARPATNRR